jgi:hypothetical protein
MNLKKIVEATKKPFVRGHMKHHAVKYKWASSILVGIFLLHVWQSHITTTPIEKDASHTLRMGINLLRHGVISLDKQLPYTPTMYREPVPAIMSAATVGIIESAIGPTEAANYYDGNRAKYVKYQNIAWLALLTLGVFWAIIMFSSSFVLALVGVILVNMKIPGISSGPIALGVDRLYTELPAAALLMISSTLLAFGVQRRRVYPFALAGFLFGVLALTKAAFLYIFVGIVLIAVVRAIYILYSSASWHGALHALVICLSFLIAVGPWMLRNYYHLDNLAISDRGGGVLNIRATLNEMTSEEYRGTFYCWAPERLRPIIGPALGFSPSDLEKGGRLQRLNRTAESSFADQDLAAEREGRPEDAISYYRKARAENVKLRRQLEDQGHPSPRQRARDILQDRSLRSIAEDPGKHLRLTLALIWRGAPVAFPIIFMTLLYALAGKREDLFFFVLPAFGVAAFYALLTHFIPRYGVPIGPVAIATFIVAAASFFHSRQERRIL